MPLDKAFSKPEKTVTYVGSDGNELEVVANASPQALRILKKQGFKKQSEVFRDEDEAAEAKAEAALAKKETSTDPDGVTTTSRAKAAKK